MGSQNEQGERTLFYCEDSKLVRLEESPSKVSVESSTDFMDVLPWAFVGFAIIYGLISLEKKTNFLRKRLPIRVEREEVEGGVGFIEKGKRII